MCDTSRRITPSAAYAIRKSQIYNVTICNTYHARWRSIWFCPIPGCPCSLSSKEGLVRHLQSIQHARGIEINLGRRVAKQIANQNCFWPVNQTMADKLLRASKRIIRYVALYSMAGVAMDSRLFRIPKRQRHAFHGRLRSIPNTKDELEPSDAYPQ